MKVVQDPKVFEWDFFIAHAGADKDTARKVYELMRPHSRVFLDCECLLPGDDWPRVISKAQKQSRITVALISAASQDAYYQNEEIAAAIQMARANNNFHRLVPVFLQGWNSSGADIPYGLRLKHGIFVDEVGLGKAAQQLLDLLSKLDGKINLTPRALMDDSMFQQAVRLVGQIDYHNLYKSRQALKELKAYLDGNHSDSVREQVIAVVKDLILTIGDFEGDVVPAPLRQIRAGVLDIIKAAAGKDFGKQFQDQELEYLDLYGMDFSRQPLTSVSFRGCFLVKSDFRSSNLQNASFAQSYIRNVDFAGANLANTDFTDADWFNASGLVKEQLRKAQHGTIMDCPTDIQAMHRYLDSHYGSPFASWAIDAQEQLIQSWQQYLQPGGLKDLVASWRIRNDTR